MRMRYVLLVVAVLVLAGCADAAPTAHPTEIVPTPVPQPTLNPAGDAAHGAALFVTWQCAHCHRSDARGGVGPALAATQLDEMAFTAAIRQTRPPKPAFSEAELSASDVHDIYVWLQTLEPASEAASLSEGELLGIQVYTSSGCDGCHGAFAQGGEGPVLAGYQDSADAFLSAMESTAADIPGHNLDDLGRDLMGRLYNWLKEGANISSGC
jgi:mono/diheme cytochrome c family protein